MLNSDRFKRDAIEVTRETGSRGSDGFEATGTQTVLSSEGDAQDLALDAEATPAVFEDGGLRFYATESVAPCRPGDDATITLEEGSTIEATVEAIELDGNTLVLSYSRGA